ncbi:MAG: hypothetical protein ACRCZ9_08660 [Fusobacteriaceae bacterium]
MAESKSCKLYEGFSYTNSHDRTDKWLTKSIHDEDVVMEKTDRFTYQCKGDTDYEQHLVKISKDYDEKKITVLVREGEVVK